VSGLKINVHYARWIDRGDYKNFRKGWKKKIHIVGKIGENIPPWKRKEIKVARRGGGTVDPYRGIGNAKIGWKKGRGGNAQGFPLIDQKVLELGACRGGKGEKVTNERRKGGGS